MKKQTLVPSDMFWTLGLALCTLMQFEVTSAQSCNMTEQPMVTRLNPPSGTTGQDRGVSSIYTIQGANLDSVSTFDILLQNMVISPSALLERNSTVISFRIPQTTVNRRAGGSPATLRIFPINTFCQNISLQITLHDTPVVVSAVSLEATPGTTIITGSGTCVPNTCGDNSTSFNFVVGGITLEQFTNASTNPSTVVARFPNFDSEMDEASFIITTQYQQFDLPVSNNFRLGRPGRITSIVPSQGQKGTRVAISGTMLLGLGNFISLSRVLLGGVEADITGSTTDPNIIEIRAGARGMPGNVSLTINTTHTFPQVSRTFDGPYIYRENAWTQLDDGLVRDIIPPAAQPGKTVLLCGDRLLGGGRTLDDVRLATQMTALFNSTPTTLNSTLSVSQECITAVVPTPSVGVVTGIVVLTADTGAEVESLTNFTFASIDSVTPMSGQPGAVVTIRGVALLSGYATATPTVVLSGVEAQILNYNSTTVVVRAVTPPVPQGSGMMLNPNDLFGTPGDISISVSANFTSLTTFSVSAESSWTYLPPGEITDISPTFGQFMTRIRINGSNLLGYGTSLVRATIGGVDAIIENAAESQVILLMPDLTTAPQNVTIMLFSDSGATIIGENLFEYRQEGSITSVTPSSGQRGTYVNITGNNLFGYANNITSVTLGSVAATVDYSQATNTSIVVRASAMNNTMATSVPVTIVANTNAVVMSNTNIWTYLVQGNIDTVSPGEGQEGTRIEISGTNLLGGGTSVERIFLDGVQGNVESASATRIVVTMRDIGERMPTFFSGQVYIMADTGAIVFGGGYTHRFSGQITSFSPQRGRRGTRVTLSGVNLLGFGDTVVQVLVAGMPGIIETFDNSSATISVGTTTAGLQGPIQLIINTGAVITSTTNFTYEPMGVISAIAPTMGAEGSGLLIRGTALSPTTADIVNVTIGGNPVSRIVTAADSEISVIIGPAPALNPTSAMIVITSSDGSVVDGESFTFISLVITLPGRNRGQEGTYIDIQLPNTSSFEPSLSMRVTIDDQEAQVTSVNATLRQITVQVPRARGQGTFAVDVAVENSDRLVARLRNGFTYLTEGTIFSIDPNFGQRGTVVVIRGTNLLGGGTRIDTASLAGVQANVRSSTNDTILLDLMQNLQSASYPQLGDVILTADTGATIRRLSGFSLVEPGEITSASPRVGQFGTQVTINGRNLLQGTSSGNVSSVLLSGVPATIVGTPTETQIIVEASNSVTGMPGQIEVILTSGARVTSPASVTFGYLEPCTVDTVNPNSGPVGTNVIIRGAGLLGGGSTISQVLLGDAQAIVTGFSDNEINVTATQGTAGRGDVVIISNTGTTINSSNRWTYEDLGNITQVTPTIGQQGVAVTITGQSLLSSSSSRVTECLIAGIAATAVRTNGRSEVECVAGFNPNSGAPLTGPISITTDTGVRVASAVNVTNFTYYPANIDRIEPTRGNNGTLVTITGTNLYGFPESMADIQQIRFGNVVADVISRTPSSIQVRVGASAVAIPGNSVVVQSTSGAFLQLPNAWNYTQPRTFNDISPSSGSPGEVVYLYGESLNLASATVRVIVGGVTSHNAQVINDTTLQFTLGVYQGVANPGVNLTIQVVYSTGETLYNDSVTFIYNTTEGNVSSISPQAGNGQAIVTINGTNLLNNQSLTRVMLAGISATVLNATEESIILEAGNASSEGSSGPVVIERGDGTLVGLAGNTWTYYTVITLNSVSPQTGQNGTVVTIDLSQLSTVPTINRVTLTGVPVTQFSFNTTSGILQVLAAPSALTTLGQITVEFNDNSVLRIDDAWSYQRPVVINSVTPGMLGYFNTSIVLNGSNFQAGGVTVVSVTLAGVQTTIESQNNSQLRLRIVEQRDTASGPIVGPIVITSSQGATFISSNNFTYVQVRINSVSPQRGQRGTRVTVSGIGVLLGGTMVSRFWLGGVNATVVSANDSWIMVEAGAFPTQTNLSDVSYVMDSGAVVTIPNSWTYVVPGEILSVTPAEGNMGTLVTIMGTNLFGGGDSAEMVILNSVPAIEIVVNFDTLIQVLAGPSTTQLNPGNVQVIANTGAVTESAAGSSVVFGYLEPGQISSVSPDDGQNGTEVQVMGAFLHNGEGIRRVLLAGIEAEIVNISENSMTGFPATINLIARRPSSLASFSGPVVIESYFNTTTVSSQNFTYLPEGLILAVSPSDGQNRTNVTITGQNLAGGGTTVQEVYLAGVQAIILSRNQTRVVVYAGESSIGLTGDVVLVSNTNAYVRRIGGWTYIAQGLVTSISPSMGQFGTRVNISGQRLLLGASSVQSVLFDNIPAYEIVSSSDTSIMIRVGQGQTLTEFTTSSITIQSDMGGVLYQEITWNYTDPSQIVAVNPTNGMSLEEVTVNGTNLLGGGTRISSVTVAGIPATMVAGNSTTVTFVTGINTQGSDLPQGIIVIESDTGARTESLSVWRYNNDCPPGTYGTTGNCRPCNVECSLCRGPTDFDCLTCANFSLIINRQLNQKQCVPTCANVSTLGRECRDACELNQYVRVNSSEDQEFCYNCSDLCDPNRQCSGPEPTQCGACRNFYNTLNGSCVEECPVGTYSNESSSCLPCDAQCTAERGCNGPSSAECNECANVRVSANLIADSSLGSHDICLARCPSMFYLDSLTQTCLPCAAACAMNCTGPSPFDCAACLNNSFVFPNDSRKCVSTCNANVTMQLFYDDLDNVCRRCDDRCSKTGGCRGPTATECNGCATPELEEGVCVISCNDTHYHDMDTNLCVRCHETCTIGCTGTTAQDCITGPSPFAAGAGTTAIVIIIVLALVFIVGLLVFFLIWFNIKRGQYKVEGPSPINGDLELGDRYTPANDTIAAKNSKEQGEPVGIVNTGFSEDLYSEAGPDGENVADSKEDLAPELYTDMSSPDMKKSEGETGSQDILYTDMSPAPLELDTISPQPTPTHAPVRLTPAVSSEPTAPARPPKPGDKPKQEKPPPPDPHIYKVPVKREEASKPAVKPAPECPPTPEMYTDMRGGIHELHLNNQDAGLSQELYDDVSASTPESPKRKADDQAPLITNIDDVYEDTDTAIANAQEYISSNRGSGIDQLPPLPTKPSTDSKARTLPPRPSQSSISLTPLPPLPASPGTGEVPPALPQRPAPKKRPSSGTPLPQTPLQKSLSGSSIGSTTSPTSPTSPVTVAPSVDDIYEDTVPPEESLYEPIPAREQLISEQSSQQQSKAGKGSKQKGGKKRK